MTYEELVKKAFEYRKELVPYTELGYPDVAIPVYEALDIDRAYIAGAEFGYNKAQEENEQLKQQIEKMKCCWNCNKYNKEFNSISSMCFGCKNKSKWELA